MIDLFIFKNAVYAIEVEVITFFLSLEFSEYKSVFLKKNFNESFL